MAENLDRDLQHMYKVIDKLDMAIEKLSDVSTDIKQILAVHEQRLDQTESIMERHFVQMDAVHNRVSNLRDDMNTTHQETLERIAEINKWRWQIMGGAAVIATVITMMGELMSITG